MNKKYIFEYDQTKKMLNTLRKLNENKTTTTKTLTEQEEDLKNDVLVINDVDVKMLFSDDMDREMDEDDKNAISNIIDLFKQQVTDLVEFEPGMTITPEQIRLDGVIQNLDFKFTLVAGNEMGLYINCEMTKVSQELIDILGKFNRFFQTYVDGMNNIITKRKNN